MEANYGIWGHKNQFIYIENSTYLTHFERRLAIFTRKLIFEHANKIMSHGTDWLFSREMKFDSWDERNFVTRELQTFTWDLLMCELGIFSKWLPFQSKTWHLRSYEISNWLFFSHVNQNIHIRTWPPLTTGLLCGFQLAPENRLPLYAFHPLLPGLRGKVRHPRRHQRQDGVDLLPSSHHRAHPVRAMRPWNTRRAHFIHFMTMNECCNGFCSSVCQ